MATHLDVGPVVAEEAPRLGRLGRDTTGLPALAIASEANPNAHRVADDLRRKGLTVLVVDSPIRLTQRALASLVAQEVDLAEPKFPGYGEYRQFLPRKKQRW